MERLSNLSLNWNLRFSSLLYTLRNISPSSEDYQHRARTEKEPSTKAPLTWENASHLTWKKRKPWVLLFENYVDGFELSNLDVLLFVKCGRPFLQQTQALPLEMVNDVSCPGSQSWRARHFSTGQVPGGVTASGSSSPCGLWVCVSWSSHLTRMEPCWDSGSKYLVLLLSWKIRLSPKFFHCVTLSFLLRSPTCFKSELRHFVNQRYPPHVSEMQSLWNHEWLLWKRDIIWANDRKVGTSQHKRMPMKKNRELSSGIWISFHLLQQQQWMLCWKNVVFVPVIWTAKFNRCPLNILNILRCTIFKLRNNLALCTYISPTHFPLGLFTAFPVSSSPLCNSFLLSSVSWDEDNSVGRGKWESIKN